MKVYRVHSYGKSLRGVVELRGGGKGLEIRHGCRGRLKECMNVGSVR